jgi:hypothetical protein
MKSFKQFFSEELIEEASDYTIKKTSEKKQTLAHPNGKPIHNILHKGEVVGTIEPYSAYREKRKPGSRIVTSRTNITNYSVHFHAGKGPTKSADIPMYHKMQHTSPVSALKSAAEVHSSWLKKNESVELDEAETKYVVKGKSPFYKQDHYLDTHTTPSAHLIKKNIKHATRMSKDEAEKLAKDWGRLSGGPNKYSVEIVPVNEEVDLDEDTMPGNVALRLVDRHQAAAFHHKKNDNMKGYAAHFKVANAIEDSVIRAGRDMPIKSKRLEAASDKAFKEHPHRVIKSEEVDITEATTSKFKRGDKVHYETSRDSKDNKGVVHSHDGDQVTIIGKDWLGGPQKITVHQGFVRKQ